MTKANLFEHWIYTLVNNQKTMGKKSYIFSHTESYLLTLQLYYERYDATI